MLRQVTSALLVALVGFSHYTYARNGSDSQTPKAIVLAFYKLALQDLKPADAFARYAGPDFLEHSQDTAGGTATGTVEFLKGLIARSPHPIAEIFRVRNGKLVEHWDVISGPPEKAVNPNSRF